jgi:pimeloyl-ACP methyl ester carboxylesterase
MEKLMQLKRARAVRCALALWLALAGQAVLGQTRPLYVGLGPAKALYYTPDAGKSPSVGFVIIHRTANFLDRLACRELPKRGFAALCVNTRFDNNESLVDWDRIALDVKASVEFLRGQPGIKKVVLFGHSGGGPTSTFYQAVAENGIAFCKDPGKIAPCRDDLANLPRADAIILADAHPGVPVILLRSLNGSVIDETPGRFDPALDPFLIENGYRATESSRYSADFEARYYASQSKRMNALIDKALGRKKAIDGGSGPYPDNDIFLIPHGGNPGAGPGGASQLHSLDVTNKLRSTRSPRRLLKNDGTISVQVVVSVSPPELETKATTNSFDSGVKLLTLRSFLTTQAIRSTNAFDGIDHCSSNNSTVCAVRSISVPILVMGMGGYLFIRDSEEEFENAKSGDKELVFIEGATHGFTPCTTCGAANAYSNSVRNMFDHIQSWTNARMP